MQLRIQLKTVLWLLVAMTAPALAQTEATKVTKAQVAQYRSQAEAGCRQAGVQQGDPEDKVKTFCTCLIASLDKSMTMSDWQQAFVHSRAGRAEDELKVLEPHLKEGSVCVQR